MRVMIIPEDFHNDQYMLKPLFVRLFRSMGIPSVRVEVCRNPRLRGVAEALRSDHLSRIVRRHGGMTDVFILCVDRDGVVGRRQRLDQLEAEFGSDWTFFAENAWEEIETWVLAGLDLPRGWRWADVRAEVQVKETYFAPLAARRGLYGSPDGGRNVLAREASRRIGAIRQKCREDFDALARRLEVVA